MSQAAFTRDHQRKWWVFIRTPNGTVVRLHTSYETKALAEQAIAIYGYRLLSEPDMPSNDTAA